MDVFDLFAKISLDSKDYDRSLQNSKDQADEWATKFAMSAKAAGSAFMSLGRGIAGIVNQATSSYSNFQQLEGGVETLFKESADQVIKNAKMAYTTAGMSANEYMETATSFSASLLQGLGGDTAKAADYADRAIRDMSDNANKMGTSIGAIQNAYQGFAKQNYTMLDNLKLGYGGTKTEMERLIKDASKMKDVQKKLGVTVNANSTSFDNIIAAISVMQESLGIAGTTSEEAANTLEGSMKSMRGAWDNLLTSLVTGGDYFDDSVDAFVDSVVTNMHNMLPAIEGAMRGVSSLLVKGSEILSKELPSFLAEILPDFINAVSSIISGIIDAMPGLLQTLKDVTPLIADALANLTPDLIAFILEGIPNFVDAGLTLLQNLVAGFSRNIDTIVPTLTQGLIDMVDRIGEIIDSNALDLGVTGIALLSNLADALIEAVPSVGTQVTQMLQDLTSKISDSTGEVSLIQVAVDILTRLANSMAESIPKISTELVSAVSAFVTEFASVLGSNTTSLANSGISILKKLIDGISTAVPQVMTDITTAVMAIIDAIVNTITGLDIKTFLKAAETIVSALTDGIVQSVGVITEKLPEIIGTITEWIENPENLNGIVDSAVNIINTLANGLVDSANKVVEVLPDLITEILGWLSNPGNLTTLADGAVSIIENLATGLTSAITKITEKLPELITDIVDWLIDPAHLTEMTSAALDIFGAIVSNVPQIVESIAVGLGGIVQGIVSYFEEHGNEIYEGFKSGIAQIGEKGQEIWEEKIKPAFDTMFENIKTKFSEFAWFDTVSQWFESLRSSIEVKWAEISASAMNFVEEIKTKVTNLPNEIMEAGKQLIEGFVNGITSKWEELKGNVTDVLSSPLDWIKDKFKIESPSKVFYDMGGFIDEGFADGIVSHSNLINSAMDEITTIPDVSANMNVNSVNGIASAGGFGGTNYGGFNITVYGAQGMDEMTLAQMVADQVRDQVVSIGATA